MSVQDVSGPVAAANKLQLFEQMAAHHLPGVLYSFNIADFKRRNSHLGHNRGDRDVREFDDALNAMAPGNAVAARVDGARWLMLCARNKNALVQAMLDGYRQREPLRTGWQIDGRRHGICKAARMMAEAEVVRSVRCLFREVMNAGALDRAIVALRNEDFDLPVDTPLHVPEGAALTHTPWRCVTRYPDSNPVCPFCGGGSFTWTGGDGAVYSGEGTCTACGAEIAISTID